MVNPCLTCDLANENFECDPCDENQYNEVPEKCPLHSETPDSLGSVY